MNKPVNKPEGGISGNGDKIPRSPPRAYVPPIQNSSPRMRHNMSPRHDNTGQGESLAGLLAAKQQSSPMPNHSMKAPLDQDDLNNRDHAASHNEMPSQQRDQYNQKDAQINELSDMVKELLREQQELKE
jgi:hypothetical protein